MRQNYLKGGSVLTSTTISTRSIFQRARQFSLTHSRNSQIQDEALRILFCGADAFSIESLKAIYSEFKSGDSNISSIDVLTKKDKKSGRGLKHFKAPPIKDVAIDLGLPIHQIDTFRGWNPPKFGTNTASPINLIIAVSFGLLIPSRVLNSSKYGGLNVHPSMLPDLRGAAPIQWAIIQGRRTTGVSIQTLHPTKFDEGLVLDQSVEPGITIPNPDEINFIELRDLLAPIGAEMLVRAIRNRLYLSPIQSTNVESNQDPSTLSLAPRITTSHRAIDFQSMNALEILRRNRAIPKLYTFGTALSDQSSLRIILGTDMRAPHQDEIPTEVKQMCSQIPIGTPYAILNDSEDILNCNNSLFINTIVSESSDLSFITVPNITIAGSSSGPASMAAARAHLFEDPITISKYRIYQFASPLSIPAMDNTS